MPSRRPIASEPLAEAPQPTSDEVVVELPPFEPVLALVRRLRSQRERRAPQVWALPFALPVAVWECELSPDGSLDPCGPLLRQYDAGEQSTQLLRAACAVDTSSDKEVLAFVNRWGLLHCRSGGRDSDSIARTRETLDAARRLVRWLTAIRERRWSSPDIPRNDELTALVPDSVNDPATVAGRRHLAQEAFPFALQRELAEISLGSPVVSVAGSRRGIDPARQSPFVSLLPLGVLRDALFLEICRWFEGVESLAFCPICHAPFPRGNGAVPPRRRHATYCSDECRRARERRKRTRSAPRASLGSLGTRACVVCGKRFAVKPKGEKRKTCGGACRVRASRARSRSTRAPRSG